jgi:enoyl-CoA hydratase/carnithine racemase
MTSVWKVKRIDFGDCGPPICSSEGERELRAAVLTGAGTMFVAGADVRQLRAFARPDDVEEFTDSAPWWPLR